MIEQFVRLICVTHGIRFPENPKITLTRKPTPLEILAYTTGCSGRSLLDLPEYINALDAHRRQLGKIQRIKSLLNKCVLVAAPDVFKGNQDALQDLRTSDLIVVVSGDDYLKTVIRNAGDQTIVLPINADDRLSEGALLARLHELEAALLDHNLFAIECWQRMRVTVDGARAGDCFSIFAGDARQLKPSVFDLRTPDLWKRRVESRLGALFYTGTESTGWATSAGFPEPGERKILTDLKSNSKGILFVDQPFIRPLHFFENTSAILGKLTNVFVKTLMVDGILVLDNTREFYLPRYSEISIKFENQGFSAAIRRPDKSTDESYALETLFLGRAEKHLMTRYEITISGAETDPFKETQLSTGLYVCTRDGFEDFKNTQTRTPHTGARFDPESCRFDMTIMGNRSSESTVHAYSGSQCSFLGLNQSVWLCKPKNLGATQKLEVILDSYKRVPLLQTAKIELCPDPIKVIFPRRGIT